LTGEEGGRREEAEKVEGRKKWRKRNEDNGRKRKKGRKGE
jgi:hypothetical protein